MLTTRGILGAGVLALALALSGCIEDQRSEAGSAGAITGPEPALSPSGSAGAGLRPERLARRVARAMRNPAFRAYVKAQLDHSTIREHKLQFQTFLRANGRRAMTALAAENDESESGVEREADSAIALEFYLPVPSHRAAWTGDENILVATAERDGDIPVAFDTRGRRTLLDPRTPPATPVLAIVPVETDFSPAPGGVVACLDPDECPSGGGGSGGGTGGGTGGGSPSSGPHGLFMTGVHIVDNYEGWLKGSPEYEVHVLGQIGQSDSMTTYQCAGEHAGGPYQYDQDGHDWWTPVLLFSQTQLDNYRAAHPGRAIRVLFVEDDDTACQIRIDPDRAARFVQALTDAYGPWTGGTDSTFVGTVVKTYARAKSALNLWAALASLIKTNDELIGNAIEDSIVGDYAAGFNWFIKGEYNITTGWVKLEMR